MNGLFLLDAVPLRSGKVLNFMISEGTVLVLQVLSRCASCINATSLRLKDISSFCFVLKHLLMLSVPPDTGNRYGHPLSVTACVACKHVLYFSAKRCPFTSGYVLVVHAAFVKE